MSIDWTNPKEKVSQFFTVKECLWLPQWSRMATEADGLTDEVRVNLFNLCHKMDVIRDKLQGSINVHCCYRPAAYNELVKGAKNSSHKFGQALDYSLAATNCDDVRATILKLDLLNKLELRMEKLPGSNWVHLDTRAPGPGGRYFTP